MDARIALRHLLKSPGYTAAAVLTLALAIGANSAIFSAVYGVLLKPLPIRQPNDLVICWASDLQRDLPVVELSYRNFEGWAARSRSFSQTAAVGSSTWPAVLQTRAQSVRLSSAGVSVSFFDTLDRARSLLLIVQIGLAVVLLVAAGLVARSFRNLRSIDLGFTPGNVLAMNLSPQDPQPSANEWMNQLIERVSVLPEIQAAGAVYLRPLALGPIGQETSVILEGQRDTQETARQNPTLNYQVATPGYFRAMRIERRRGRLFDASDNARSLRVALVSAGTARRLWPGRDPIGRRMLMPTQTPDGPPTAWRTVVGVVSDVRYRGIDDVRLDVYDAALQSPASTSDLVVRTSGDPLRAAAAVQAAARALDPRVVIDRLTTMDAIVARTVAPWRFGVWMFGVFATLAFVMASVGLFTLVSLEVAARRHEFAVRMALGARQSELVRSVMVVAGRRVLVGITFGLCAALVAVRGMRSILFGVSTLDAATYGAVVALVAVVVAVASYLPARHASRIDPLDLLKRGQQ